MIFWQNHTLAKWYCGKDNILAKSCLAIHTGRFPNKHSVQSKRFCKLVHEITAVGMAEEPPIQRFLIFTRKTAARTSWSKRTPQEPELYVTKSDFDLLIRLRQIARCAQIGARLACVLSSRVPGRRDAAVHEYALKSRAAHSRFPCKNGQPSLNLRCFGSWNHVSWSFYQFTLCDKRHCLQVLWLEAGTTHCKQANTIQVFES